MQNLVPADVDARLPLASGAYDNTPRPEPYQLSFLSPLPGAVAGDRDNPYENDHEYIDCTRRLRRRRCRSITKSDVEATAGATDTRALLRKRGGEFLPPLYACHQTADGNVMQPADAATIIDSAEALLAYRFQRGVKILQDPFLLLRFLRIRLVSQRQPIFAAFFMDRKQRLIRFAELFHGTNDRVTIYPKEVVRDALACSAEQLLCVRSDPIGDHQPTMYDVEDARRIKRALELMAIPLVDYVVVGESVTSLLQRGVI
jgi:DNA repair protein RadC